MNPQFSFHRFRRLFLNDALRVARPALLTGIVLLCIISVIYVGNFEPGSVPVDPPLSTGLFAVYLMGAGLLLTSVIFRDMHHPLERYHYLMLPVSNLERFLSRYLLTGPVLALCLLVSFAIMDWVGNQLASWLKDASAPYFSVTAGANLLLLRIYLFAHVIGFLGATCFRSMQLVRTLLAAVGFAFSMGVAGYLAMRIFYFDAFRWGSLKAVKPIHLSLAPLFEASWMNWAFALAAAFWLLYIAYRCLKAHEVQNGI